MRKFVLPIVFLAVGLIIGMALVFSMAFDRGFLAGQDDVEAKYQAKIKQIWPPLEAVYIVNGKVKEVQDDTIVMEVNFGASNPFEEPLVETRLVKITDATELVQQMPKTQAEYEIEIQEYGRAMTRNPDEPIPMPTYTKEIELELSDLGADRTVVVQSEENIKAKTEFAATKIVAF